MKVDQFQTILDDLDSLWVEYGALKATVLEAGISGIRDAQLGKSYEIFRETLHWTIQQLLGRYMLEMEASK